MIKSFSPNFKESASQHSLSTTLGLLLICFTASVTSARGGPGDGGGGKGVMCRASGSRFPVQGFYALDYAVDSGGNNAWTVKDGNVQSQLRAVADLFSNQLKSYYPKAGPQMQIFAAAYGTRTQTDYQNFDLINTQDPPMGQVPSNCERVYTQITVKKESYYCTHPQLEQELAKTNVQQLSAHWVHEMLRLAIGDSTSIAKWNQQLHRSEILQMSSADLVATLRNAGVISPEIVRIGQLRIAMSGQKDQRVLFRILENEVAAFEGDVTSLLAPLKVLENRVSVITPESYCNFARQNLPELQRLQYEYMQTMGNYAAINLAIYELDQRITDYSLTRKLHDLTTKLLSSRLKLYISNGFLLNSALSTDKPVTGEEFCSRR